MAYTEKSLCDTEDADIKSQTKPDVAIDLNKHIPALCLALGGKVALHAKRHSAQQLGLDLSEWRIIQVLGARGRTTIFDIADCIAMDRGGTSRAVARMEKNNYLLREADATDRRRSFVKLAPKGMAVHDEIVHFSLAREERLLQQLSAEDRARMRELLIMLTNEARVMVEEEWMPAEDKR